MRANRYTALVDACSLAGALPRNMILSLAEAGFFRPRWSREVIAETEKAIASILAARAEPDHDAKAARHIAEIVRAFPEAMVEGYEHLIPALTLPDENDLHVLAAAIQTRASVVVTENLAHFPNDYLDNFHLRASSADEFLADIIDLSPAPAVAALRQMRLRLKRPELTAEALIRRMESIGLTETVNLLICEIDAL